MSAFPPDVFRGSRFAVLGLGRNGLAVARALLAMGAEVTVWDDAPAARAAAGAVPLRDPCEGDFAADALVLSPGIPHLLPRPHPAAARARAADVPILSDAELLFQAVRRAGSKARFAGITGTNGKSTTTALLAHILDCAGVPAAAGGNLGTAALALPLLPDDGVYVLEMSSYMLEQLATLRFDAAVMLNLSPDHLDRHGDMAGYIAAKRAIFDRQESGDLAVVGVDDADSRAMAAWLRDRPAQVVTVSGQVDKPVAGNAKRSPPPLEGGGRGEGSVQPPPPQTSLLPYARRMRGDPTPAERKLWQALRKHQAAGLKFRRQMPLGPFIVDFYCSAARLVVELDGISHIDSQTDPARDAWMEGLGIRVVRFANQEVLSNCEGVCLAIEQIARSTPPPNPLPQGEGEFLSASLTHPRQRPLPPWHAQCPERRGGLRDRPLPWRAARHHRARNDDFLRTPAPPATAAHDRRRHLHQRQQGNQCRCRRVCVVLL